MIKLRHSLSKKHVKVFMDIPRDGPLRRVGLVYPRPGAVLQWCLTEDVITPQVIDRAVIEFAEAWKLGGFEHKYGPPRGIGKPMLSQRKIDAFNKEFAI